MRFLTGMSEKLMIDAKGHTFHPLTMIISILVLMLCAILEIDCPFKMPIIIKNAEVFMTAPRVIESMSHLVMVFFQLSLGLDV